MLEYQAYVEMSICWWRNAILILQHYLEHLSIILLPCLKIRLLLHFLLMSESFMWLNIGYADWFSSNIEFAEDICFVIQKPSIA